jgi:prepilin-type N-terminal cleavage/methylation domain-containing protein
MMKNRGVTLIELVIVIAIIGILVIALGFSYQGWMGRYKVERVTKDIYSDLMTARSMAMSRNRSYFVDFPTPTSYTMFEDSNDDSVFDPADAELPSFPKTVEYDITWAEGAIAFDKRGLIQPEGTIRLVTLNDPDYDCIVISQTRINMGKLDGGGACDAK